MEHPSLASRITRRRLLATTAIALVLGADGAGARTISGTLTWSPGIATPPLPVQAGPWLFFSPVEAALVKAAVDHLIPSDQRGPGGKYGGCAVFTDRQLAGPYGRADGRYMRPPFMPGAATRDAARFLETFGCGRRTATEIEHGPRAKVGERGGPSASVLGALRRPLAPRHQRAAAFLGTAQGKAAAAMRVLRDEPLAARSARARVANCSNTYGSRSMARSSMAKATARSGHGSASPASAPPRAGSGV